MDRKVDREKIMKLNYVTTTTIDNTCPTNIAPAIVITTTSISADTVT